MVCVMLMEVPVDQFCNYLEPFWTDNSNVNRNNNNNDINNNNNVNNTTRDPLMNDKQKEKCFILLHLYSYNVSKTTAELSNLLQQSVLASSTSLRTVAGKLLV